MTTSRRRVLAGCGALALSATAGCGWIERDEQSTVERGYDASSLEAISVEAGIGALSVRPHDGDELRVRGEKSAASDDAIDALSLNERRAGDRLALETDADSGPWPTGWWRSPKFDLRIEVPANVRVERTETSSDDLEIESIAGPLSVRTDTGDVYVSDVTGAVDIGTDTGKLIVRDATAPIRARSDTGSVTVDGILAEVRTDTGRVEATVRDLAESPTIASNTGDVSIALSRSLDATVTVTTDTGDLDTFGSAFADAETSDDEGTFVVGDGTDSLAVTTDTGDVSIGTLE